MQSPCLLFREVMVIVQISPEFPTPVEDIETNDLKPYQNNSQDPYITAYFKAGVLPLLFVIGDGKEFNFGNESYYNQPLKQNSSYIVFLRFFETNVSFSKNRKCEVTFFDLSLLVNLVSNKYYFRTRTTQQTGAVVLKQRLNLQVNLIYKI